MVVVAVAVAARRTWHCAAFGSMLLPLVSPSPSFGRVLAAFCLFEATIGAFNPAFGVLRAEAIPPGIQSTVRNLYRLPLNFVVAGGTRLGSVGGWQAVVLMNSLTLPLALALQTVAATQRKGRRLRPPPRSPVQWVANLRSKGYTSPCVA